MRNTSLITLLAALAVSLSLACSDDSTLPPDSWVKHDSGKDGGQPDASGVDSGGVDQAAADLAGSDAATVSFSTSVLPVLVAKCSSSYCHGGTNPAGGLGITSTTAYTNLVGKASTGCPSVVQVKPGDINNSYLMFKLSGKGGSCYKGDQMPKGGTPLISADVANISNWIQQGAANN